MQMPKSNNDEQAQSSEQNQSADYEKDEVLHTADDEAPDEDMSEVARRINLLGKLVIPPSPPSPS